MVTTNEVVAPPKPQPPKPGWKTTEFWLTVGTIVATHVLDTAKIIPGPWGFFAKLAIDGLAVFGYNLSRGLAKR